MARLSHEHPASVPVPIPDRIASLIGSTLPQHVLQAEFDAVSASREVLRFRGPLCAEDQQDREQALAALARANKVLAKHHPLMIVRGAA